MTSQRQPKKRAPVLDPGAALDDDLTVLDHLGGSRKVDLYLCRSDEFGVVAVKVLRPEFRIHFNSLDDIREEGETLQRLHHPNVIEGYAMELMPHPHIVMTTLRSCP